MIFPNSNIQICPNKKLEEEVYEVFIYAILDLVRIFERFYKWKILRLK